jgi:hypothetical protein
MNGSELAEAVREATKTERSRLGSSKSLYADTEGEMEPDAVLSAAADDAHHAADVLDGWTDDDVEGVFAAASEGERDRADEVARNLDDYDPGTAPAAADALGDLETEVERLGGLVGWTLVTEEKASQCSGFFTGQADPQTASLFRGYGGDYEDLRADVLDGLDTACEGDEDWDDAQAAAEGVVEAAYDEYFETLEELGVNPKPVC